MNQTQSFTPDWASPPGATISDLLEDRGYTLSDFARDIGESVENAEKLIKGTININNDIANSLANLFDTSIDFWLSREMQFRESIERLSANAQWINDFPYGDMVEYGWIRSADDINEKIAACLEFFSVPTVTDWYEKYEGSSKLAAFRTSKTFTSDEAAVLAWLRKGEIDGTSMRTKNWNRRKFEESLSNIRSLTRKKAPSKFIPELQKICAECGVAVIIARAPSGCRASGATRFISSNKALIMLSFRYLSDDHFWFTFFHEAGHLILHSETTLFLEGDNLCTGKEEEEANEFASNILVPQEYKEAMKALPVNAKTVMRFARDIGVSSGIIVGQLQHAKIFTQKQLNNLKVRYQWT